jgi:hypothetical protein
MARAAGPQRAAGSAATRRPPPSAQAERRRMNCATDYVSACPLASRTMKQAALGGTATLGSIQAEVWKRVERRLIHCERPVAAPRHVFKTE